MSAANPGSTRPTAIAVFAGAAPAPHIRAAIEAGGGRLVEIEAADVLVWADHTGTGLAEALERGEQVRWVQLGSAGVDWIFERGLYSDKYVWTCAKGSVFAESVAEMALLLLLSGFREMRRYVGATSWSAVAGKPLAGSHICIVGAGGIGAALIALLAPFGTTVTVVRRSATPVPGATVVPQSQLLDAVASADAVVLATPLTEQTWHLIDSAVLAAMRPGAWLVNVSRGGVVDTDALVAALESGHVGGAALDVVDPEPLPDGHPLWKHPRVIITPHIAVNDDLPSSAFERRITQNLRHWAAGEPLEGRVDPLAGF